MNFKKNKFAFSSNAKDIKYANALASQLLMPSLVVKQTLISVIKNENLDSNHLSQDDIELITSKASKQLGVSYGALDYRIKNLQLFETGN